MGEGVHSGGGSWEGLVLAGGMSVRMGRDKAWMSREGELWWQRQVRVLREAGAMRVWVACREEQGLQESQIDHACEVGWIFDDQKAQGPLVVLAGALDTVQRPVLALAVDMPKVEVSFLRALSAAAFSQNPPRSCVPSWEGRFEPLLALYQVSALPIFQSALQAGERSLQPVVRALMAKNLAVSYEASEQEACNFENWNKKKDLES